MPQRFGAPPTSSTRSTRRPEAVVAGPGAAGAELEQVIALAQLARVDGDELVQETGAARAVDDVGEVVGEGGDLGVVDEAIVPGAAIQAVAQVHVRGRREHAAHSNQGQSARARAALR